METEDVRQDPATETSRVVTTGIWLVVLLVGYVASVGPTVWLLEKAVLPEWLYGILYLPLIWLCQLDERSWFTRGLSWWVDCWL